MVTMIKKNIEYDIVIIGGGPAGLASALSAKDSGCDSILIIEREKELGGILNQCIHNGFGLHTFKEELTGPEYAARFITQIENRKIDFLLNTTVIEINADKVVTALNRENGLFNVHAKAIILAMGCRERSRGALNIPGCRSAGIYTAGTAQKLVNIEGWMPGHKIVILGSGDIGLIMARRLTLEGGTVKVVAEIMPYSGGLKRNIVQCLDDFDIPLKLSHTVVNIEGKERVTAVTIAEVDSQNVPIPGTEERYECDTLLLSCGLIPENELSRELGVAINPVTSGPIVNECLETSVSGVFAAGNVLHVHDLVDYVSTEAENAGRQAVNYILKADINRVGSDIPIELEGGIRYSVPSTINPHYITDDITIRFRVGSVLNNKTVNMYINGSKISKKTKKVISPGEMEEICLKKDVLKRFTDIHSIIIKIEEEP